MDDRTRTELEAAAFRRLVGHLRENSESDVARPLPGQANRRANCDDGLRMNCGRAQS